jgi:hypothetical protein
MSHVAFVPDIGEAGLLALVSRALGCLLEPPFALGHERGSIDHQRQLFAVEVERDLGGPGRMGFGRPHVPLRDLPASTPAQGYAVTIFMRSRRHLPIHFAQGDRRFDRAGGITLFQSVRSSTSRSWKTPKEAR